MKKILQSIVVSGLIAIPVFAQEVLETTIGGGLVLEIEGGISRVALADEALANMNVLNTREVLIHGRTNGRTTLFVWTDAGDRQTYTLRVNRDLEALNSAIEVIEGQIAIEESADSLTLLLKGEVANKAQAEMAGQRILEVLQTQPEPRPGLVNLLTFPDARDPRMDVDDRLLAALHTIDDRIWLRRIRVEETAADTLSTSLDSFILEGRVNNIRDLAKAIYMADRFLGGKGGKIQAADESKIRSHRRTNFSTNIGNSGNSGGGSSALNDAELIPNGLAAQVARGLILSSESQRVISFLEVDNLEQILVSIRVLEIDRKKARSIGVNYQVNADQFTLASLNAPIGAQFPVVGQGLTGSIARQSGNIVGAYVSNTASLMGAIELLQQRAVARSVAEPNVLTLTGEEASVLVGGEVPIPTTSVGNVASVQGFQFQSFGVRLDIRPTINEEGLVMLEVAPSIVRPSLALGNGDVPGFEVQTVQTSARVPAGGSLVLGGLLTFEEGIEERGIPILSRIPIIGYLFKWKKRLRDEKELLFVMTPRLINELEPQEIPELPLLESRHKSIDDQLVPQQLENDGVPELWRNPEPVFPPNVCEPEDITPVLTHQEVVPFGEPIDEDADFDMDALEAELNSDALEADVDMDAVETEIEMDAVETEVDMEQSMTEEAIELEASDVSELSDEMPAELEPVEDDADAALLEEAAAMIEEAEAGVEASGLEEDAFELEGEETDSSETDLLEEMLEEEVELEVNEEDGADVEDEANNISNVVLIEEEQVLTYGLVVPSTITPDHRPRFVLRAEDLHSVVDDQLSSVLEGVSSVDVVAP